LQEIFLPHRNRRIGVNLLLKRHRLRLALRHPRAGFAQRV
jgi:hypothetical protein